MNRIEHQHSRQREKKRKLDDVVDLQNRIMTTKSKTECLVTPPLKKSSYSYWNSSNAILLFNPIAGESVVSCLIRREELLRGATFDDDILLSLVSDIKDINELTSKQKENIRNQCLYLRKSYELAIQHMNKLTWKECCKLAIDELGDDGIYFVKNEKTVRRWHTQFRKCELFFTPNNRNEREPKLFSFFPDSKTQIVRYCTSQVNLGCLSTELVKSQIKNVIIPRCYQDLLEEAGEENRGNMPLYNKLLHMLDLSNVSMSTVWRWLVYLGYKYDENKKSYYTDGHEREDVVKDRNERFLIKYFTAERRAHRWVQLDEKVAIEMEQNDPTFPKNCSHQYNCVDSLVQK